MPEGGLNAVYSSGVTFSQVNEPHAESVFFHRYKFCGSGTVQDNVEQSLYPC